MSGPSHLGAFTQLAQASSEDERRSLWRQGMATLARAAIEQQPVPLEGIDPKLLLEAVRAAFAAELRATTWTGSRRPAAAAAVYELAAAIPIGPERRQLGRQVLMRLYEGDAETFVVLATSLAAESKRTLTGAPIRARVALALELPIGSPVSSDRLALALHFAARPAPRMAIGSRDRFAAVAHARSAPARARGTRVRAARGTGGDAGSLRAFQEPRSADGVEAAAGRSRIAGVAARRGRARHPLPAPIPTCATRSSRTSDAQLTPTEWRRAAVSLAASIALDPESGLRRCRALLAEEHSAQRLRAWPAR